MDIDDGRLHAMVIACGHTTAAARYISHVLRGNGHTPYLLMLIGGARLLVTFTDNVLGLLINDVASLEFAKPATGCCVHVYALALLHLRFSFVAFTR